MNKLVRTLSGMNDRPSMAHIKGALFAFCLLFISGFCQAHNEIHPANSSNGEIRFIENKNQWEPQVEFKLEFSAGNLFLEKDKFTYVFLDENDLAEFYHLKHAGKKASKSLHDIVIDGDAFKVNFVGASTSATTEGLEKFSDYKNYFLGNDRSKWASEVWSYQQVKYTELYDDIDMLVYGANGSLKYEFLVRPNADPADIRMEYEGLKYIELRNGKLHLETTVNEIVEQAPYSYQIKNGLKVEVPSRFILIEETNTVYFDFPESYDPAFPLVIDPTLIFSTYTGSTADNWGYTATFDSSGFLYGGGIVFSGPGYPLSTNPFQMNFGGGNPGPFGYPCDIGITKYTPDGTNIVFSTYFGGSGNETPNSLIVNSNEELVVFGVTSSNNFPTHANGFDQTFAGGPLDLVNNVIEFTSGTDIYVTKFSSNGQTLAGGTYIGGIGRDGMNIANNLYWNYGDHAKGEVIVDDSNNVYVASSTWSGDFPVTPGALQTTLLGNQDGVVFKMDPDLTSMTWCTFLGGSTDDAAYSIILDDLDNIYATGSTSSSDYPGTTGGLNPSYGGVVDGFVTLIANDGSSIIQSTYLGTTLYDQAFEIDKDFNGDIYIYGQSLGFYPVTPATVYNNPNGKQFLHKLNSALTSTFFSTTFGSGSGMINLVPTALLVDKCQNIYISGWGGEVNQNNGTGSLLGTTQNMPITSNAFQSSTDGSDFYFMVLGKDADTLLYATYFGGNGSDEHVDGGTSRFDEEGIIYQAVCAGCGGNSLFPTTPGAWSTTNNSGNCNLGTLKMEFRLAGVSVQITPNSYSGCVPLTIDFDAPTENATNIIWDFGDNTTSTDSTPTHTYDTAGVYQVMVIAFDTTTLCLEGRVDTGYGTVTVLDDSVLAEFNPIIISSCDSFVAAFNNLTNGGIQFWWDFGDGQSSTALNPTHNYATADTYIIQLIVWDSTACNEYDTVEHEIFFTTSVVAVPVSEDTTGCTPLTVNFTNNSLNSSQYVWFFGDGDSSSLFEPSHTYNVMGNYQVMLIVFDTGTCAGTDTAFLNVIVHNDSVIANFDVSTPIDCDSLVLVLDNLTQNGDEYEWFFDFSDTSHAFEPNYTFYDTGVHLIRLIATNDQMCNTPDTVEMPVTLLPKVLANFGNDDSGCEPQIIHFTDSSINATGYSWDFDDGEFSGDIEPTHLYETAGIYNVLLITSNPNTCNLLDSAFATIEVFGAPDALFETDTSVYEIFQLIDFNNLTTNGFIYGWDFGDSTYSEAENPTHAYQSEGEYTICLDVISDHGCVDTFCKVINIFFAAFIDIPNAFSPNGDQMNDWYYPRGFGITTFQLKIYNRWGEIVFESTEADVTDFEGDLGKHQVQVAGWDGNYKGKEQEMEVYVFTLEATFKDGTSAVKKGNVTLLR